MATGRSNRLGWLSAFWVPMVVGFVGASLAAGQEEPPPQGDDPASRIAERLKERGIDLSPDQIDRARRIMGDIRDGRGADPNDVRSIFGDLRKQFEARQQKRLQEQLGASDDEWKILEPKIKKVRELAQLVGEDAAGQMMMGGPGGPGGFRIFRNTDPNAPERSDLDRKTEALRKAVENPEAKPEDVAAALKVYREARSKAKGDLETARKQLRELLTVRQEAQLVTMGVLE